MLLAALGLAFLVMTTAQVWNSQQDSRIIAQYSRDRRFLVDRILELEGGAVDKMVQDYSVWGDLHEFVSSRNEQWAVQNADTAVSSYGLAGFWVCDKSGRVIHEATDGRAYPQGWCPIDQPQARNLTGWGKSFFTWVGDRLQEIRVRKLHTEAGQPAPHGGYIVCAQDVDEARLNALGAVLGGKVNSHREKPAARTSGVTFDYQIPLKGSEGNPVAWLDVQYVSVLFQSVRDRGNSTLIQSGICFISLALAAALAARRYVMIPKALFNRSVERGDALELQDLAGSDKAVDKVVALFQANAKQNQLADRNAELKKMVEDRTQGLELAGEAAVSSLVELLERRLDELSPDQRSLLELCENFGRFLGLDKKDQTALRQGVVLRLHREELGSGSLLWLDNTLFAKNQSLAPVLSVCTHADIPWKAASVSSTVQAGIFAIANSWHQARLTARSDRDLEDALVSLRLQAGTQLDPTLVASFEKFLGENDGLRRPVAA